MKTYILTIFCVFYFTHGEQNKFLYEEPIIINGSYFGPKYFQRANEIKHLEIIKGLRLHYPDSYNVKGILPNKIAGATLLIGTGMLFLGTSSFNRGINYPLSPRVFIDLSIATGIISGLMFVQNSQKYFEISIANHNRKFNSVPANKIILGKENPEMIRKKYFKGMLATFFGGIFLTTFFVLGSLD